VRVRIESIYVITWSTLEQLLYRGMLGACLRRRALKAAHRSNLSNHRYFVVQGLCDGFMDLALALPIPPSLPPYSSTIILLTIFTRLAILPISIWGKERIRRAEEIVLPEIEKLKPHVSKRVLEEMKASNIRGNKKYLRKYHDDKCTQLLTARRKELFKEYRCSPLLSIITPPLAQLPVFVTFTVVLSRLSEHPTPFDSESFFTLSTLAHADPTMTLPVILGFLSMANVESGNWVLNAAEREQERKADQEERKRILGGGKPRLHPGKVFKTILRGLSIVRIIIAGLTPGSVTLYWVSSAAFGLVQTWTVQWIDARRRRRLMASELGRSSDKKNIYSSPMNKR